MENEIDKLIKDAVFNQDNELRTNCRHEIRRMAVEQLIYPASIQGLYEAAGKAFYSQKTVPAINIRGLTYQVARAVFHAAIKDRVGAFIFEIARSEIGYTNQRPDEYAVCILAAALREGYSGPVFIQGDHFQINAKKYAVNKEAELKSIQDLIREAIAAGFYNIDIDASTIVDISKKSLEDQQEANSTVTAKMTDFIRKIQPAGVTISIGGEIGEVGKYNSTVEDLKAFMTGYQKQLDESPGISKISVQTGTSHGGVVMPDGSLVKVKVDFETLEKISDKARQDYGMAGAVQHGASTLPDEAFDRFPQANTAEVHLATGFQNIIYDSPDFPADLWDRIREHLLNTYKSERKPEDSDEQFIYKTRKKAFGDFKNEIWHMPESNQEQIRAVLTDRFSLLFRKLNVIDTAELVGRFC